MAHEFMVCQRSEYPHTLGLFHRQHFCQPVTLCYLYLKTCTALGPVKAFKCYVNVPHGSARFANGNMQLL